MNAKGINVGSGVPNKTYFKENEEVNELIKIFNYFPEFRNKKINVCDFLNFAKYQ